MADENLFSTDFSDALDTSWEIIREAPDAYCVKDNALVIHTLPGTLWGDANNAHNIFLRPEVALKDGLCTTVTVTNAPEEQGEQAGMIWFVDEDHYVKLIKENLGGEVWIVMAREEAGQGALVDRKPYPEATATLRLCLCGDEVVGQVLIGETWETVGTCEPIDGGTMKPGIYSHGGPEDAKHIAKLEKYCITLK